MQELIEELKGKGGGMEIYLNANTETIEKYLEKEKQQIMQAFQVGIDQDNNFYVAEKYYKKTYNEKNNL